MKTESVYWVFTHNCNLRCAHCYNWSRPGAPTITRAQADAVLANLPDEANRFILSGGEPLVELELLLYLLEAGRERYPSARVSFQTNGDLLDGPTLERLLATGLDAIAIASQDAFHPRPDGKFEALRELMTRYGMVERAVWRPRYTPAATAFRAGVLDLGRHAGAVGGRHLAARAGDEVRARATAAGG